MTHGYIASFPMSQLVLVTKGASNRITGPPRVLGIWGEWPYIFRELGSIGNYFKGAREQAHNFGDLGSLAKKQKKKKKKMQKPPFCLIF